jgi:hypothetical protein
LEDMKKIIKEIVRAGLAKLDSDISVKAAL